MGFIYIFVVFCEIVFVKCQIPSDNFLFGTTGSNVVWFLNGTKEWTDSNKKPTSTGINFTQNFQGLHGTSYFHARNYLVFSYAGTKSIFLSDITSKRNVYSYIGTSSSVGHVAVDWLSGNVYWCDGTFGWIGMLPLPASVERASINDKFKVVVDKYLDIPAGIAVEPSHQWIFWTDIGKQPKIERSSLEGKERNVLVLHGLILPVSITVDTTNNRIYWTDPIRGTIESCDFYGNNRKVLRTDINAQYYGIEVYKNFVFVSETSKNEILVFSDTDGRQVSDPYGPGVKVLSIGYYTNENQVVNNAACATKGCEHICIIGSDSAATCTCQDGYTLQTNGLQCAAETQVLERSIVFVNKSKICALPITYINIYQHLKILPDCDVGGVSSGAITHIAINVAEDAIYFTVDTIIYRQQFYQTASSIYTASSQITGLTFDWTTNIFYWTISESNMIYKGSISGTTQTILNPEAVISLKKPTYITISPLESVIFAVTGEKSKQIEIVNLRNSSSNSLQNTGLINSKWLTYNRPKDRLYWTDVGKVGSITSSGNDLKIMKIDGANTHGIGVYKDYLLWLQSTGGSTSMYVDELNSEDPIYSFALEDLSSPSMFVFYDKNIQPQRNVPCVKNNGGCQQICVVHGYFAKCDCHLGYQLQADELSCIPENIDTTSFLTIDQLSNRLFSVYNSTVISSVDTGVIRPTDVAVDYKTDSIIWIESSSGSSIKSIKMDGTLETTITSESSRTTSVDVDSSTSNIFYTTHDSIKVFSPKDSTKRSFLPGLSQPDHIALYPAKRKMFWTEKSNGQSVIKQAPMDGSSKEEFARYTEDKMKSPTDIVIDMTDDRLIWSDAETDTIERISLSNRNDIRVIMSNTSERPVAVDVDQQYIYFIGQGQRSVKRINKDGTNSQVVFHSILFGRLVTLHKMTETRISEHALCKTNNGQCSKLCLPSGQNTRTCQCREGISISSDGKICKGDNQCPDIYDNVDIDNQCTRYTDVSCTYECKPGFMKNPSVTEIKCLPHGSWEMESDSLCTRIMCPNAITNGNLSSICNRFTGTKCSFTCVDGYDKLLTTLECLANGQWSEDTTSVCKLGNTEPTDEGLGTGAIIGLACGGIVLIVIAVAAIVTCQLQRMRKDSQKMKEELQVAYQSQRDYNSSTSGYSYTTETTAADIEVYDEIADDKMFTEKMQTATALSESTSSHRYSKWPDSDLPPPDYLDVVDVNGRYSPFPERKSTYNSQSPTAEGYIRSCAIDGDTNGYMTPQSLPSSIKKSNTPSYNNHI
ncbi:low-density lipoprotein receptor-related protein 6-like isoform X2 [Mytilus edulis]|uniref:low-density lipoprotein receptor-related protein 6-like isoform X2 n=1 Tax=Mytilus edulis TaxID=6550 RepID=UPI0039F02600